MRRQTVVQVAFLLLVNASAAYSQPGKWAVPYDKATDAIKKQQWQAAIPLLEQAIAIDPTPSANKRVEGTFSEDYFPQYYLFVAYLKTNQPDKARQWYDRRGPLAGKLVAEAQTYFGELQKTEQLAKVLPQFEQHVKAADTALAAKQYDPAINEYDQANKLLPEEFKKRNLDTKLTEARNGAKTAGDARVAEQQRVAEATRQAAEKKKTDFTSFVSTGNTALANRQWDAAIAAYNSAKSTSAEDFASQNIQSKIDEAGRGKTADANARTEFNTLRDRANTAYNAKNWGDAAAAYSQAKLKLPSDFSAQGLEAKLTDATQKKQAVDDFEAAVKSAASALGSKNYAEAMTAYQTAKSKLPDEFAKRQLQPKLDEAKKNFDAMGAEQQKHAAYTAATNAANAAFGAKKYDETIRQLETAKQKSPDDFKKDGLQARLDEATRLKNAPGPTPPAVVAETKPQPIAVPVGALDKLAREGFVALLTGDVNKATPLLEQAQAAARNNPKPMFRATISAYLGVAYATQSLLKNNSDPALVDKAKKQYRDALSIQRAFQFEDKYVSPQVRKLLGVS